MNELPRNFDSSNCGSEKILCFTGSSSSSRRVELELKDESVFISLNSSRSFTVLYYMEGYATRKKNIVVWKRAS